MTKAMSLRPLRLQDITYASKRRKGESTRRRAAVEEESDEEEMRPPAFPATCRTTLTSTGCVPPAAAAGGGGGRGPRGGVIAGRRSSARGETFRATCWCCGRSGTRLLFTRTHGSGALGTSRSSGGGAPVAGTVARVALPAIHAPMLLVVEVTMSGVCTALGVPFASRGRSTAQTTTTTTTTTTRRRRRRDDDDDDDDDDEQIEDETRPTTRAVACFLSHMIRNQNWETVFLMNRSSQKEFEMMTPREVRGGERAATARSLASLGAFSYIRGRGFAGLCSVAFRRRHNSFAVPITPLQLT